MDWPQVFFLLFWLSVATFAGSLILLPIILIQMPADFLTRTGPAPDRFRHRHPLMRACLKAGKNFLGLVLIVAGLVMLLTPGQGVLTILAGILLLDFPGKRELERRLIGRPRVLRIINRIRARAGHPPLEVSRRSSV